MSAENRFDLHRHLLLTQLDLFSMFILFFVFDLMVICGALSVSYLLSIEIGTLVSLQVLLLSKSFYFIVFVYLFFRYIFGMYEFKAERNIDIASKIFSVLLFTSLAIILTNYLFDKERDGLYGKRVLLTGLLTASFIQTIVSMSVQGYLKKILSKRNFLFIASDEAKNWLSEDLEKKKFLASARWLVYEEWVSEEHNKKSEIEHMNDFVKSLNQKIQRFNFETIVLCVAFKRLKDPIIDSLIHLKFKGYEVYELSSFYESEFRQLPVNYLSSQVLLLKEGFNIISDPVGLRLKRFIDIILSLMLLFVTWPLMIFTMILIWLESGKPILFFQQRTGLAGKPFNIYKFRSMVVDAEKSGAQWAQVKDSRVTRVGNFIRLFRFDELPQIFNILKGDMSFIGPRPERPEFVEVLAQKIPFYELRHSLRPGLTGWAQVGYPYGSSVDDAREKLQYDLFYIKNQSFMMDLKIIVKTVRVVLFGKGR